MSNALINLMLFSAKVFILFLFIFMILIVFFTLLAKTKEKFKEKLTIKNLNKKFDENKEFFLAETLSKKDFKCYLKNKKTIEKAEKSKKANIHSDIKCKKIYILNFQGDMKASAVSSLREEITAILNVATETDEVVLRLESPGGVVHGYGLAAAQLMRIRSANIPLTIIIDKVAASGGYMMACIANKILAAPFAIVGSIGVIVQLPNFHRLLQDKHIDFEQHTAGEFKRTITMFGENTKAGREKLVHEIEDIHQLFKNLITSYRQKIDIQEVATGEHWYGQQAIDLKLVDEIKTSDEYLLSCSAHAQLYEVTYEIKKTFFSKFSAAANHVYEKLFSSAIT
jgi:serine protease SohB